jgi:hypothetical protein
MIPKRRCRSCQGAPPVPGSDCSPTPLRLGPCRDGDDLLKINFRWTRGALSTLAEVISTDHGHVVEGDRPSITNTESEPP